MRKLKIKNISNSLFILGIILLFNSCKSVINKPLIFSNCNELSEHLNKKKEKLSSLSLKQNFDALIINNGIETKVNCRLVYLGDSCLIINLLSKKIGIEVLRVKITKDSLIYLNRVKKEYYCGLLDKFLEFDNSIIKLDLLKSVMLGQCSLSNYDSICSKKNLISLHNNSILSASSIFTGSSNEFNLYYQLNNKAELESIKIFKSNDKYFYFSINYSQFTNLMDIPSSMKIDFRTANSSFVVTVLSSKISEVSNVNTIIDIPGNYKSISLNK
jgi:hypothetical protein